MLNTESHFYSGLWGSSFHLTPFPKSLDPLGVFASASQQTRYGHSAHSASPPSHGLCPLHTPKPAPRKGGSSRSRPGPGTACGLRPCRLCWQIGMLGISHHEYLICNKVASGDNYLQRSRAFLGTRTWQRVTEIEHFRLSLVPMTRHGQPLALGQACQESPDSGHGSKGLEASMPLAHAGHELAAPRGECP